jgi:hypothetical protein
MTIFDDLIQGVGREVTKVQARSQEMLQVYNLQNQIKDLERKRSAKLLELGRMACDKYFRDESIEDNAFKDKASEVVAFEREIEILQAEIDQVKVASDPNTPASTKANAKAGFNPTPGYLCPRCQAPASREKSFCPVCGESLRKSAGEGSNKKDANKKDSNKKDDDDDIIDVEPKNN